jgi:hypothetical protein
MRLGRDGIAGLVGLAVSLGLIPFALGLPKMPIVPVGPGFYPLIVLAFMAATSAVLVVQDVIVQRRAAPPSADAAAAPQRAYDLVIAAFAVVGAYVGLLPYLGYRIATVLFVATFQFVLDRPATVRQWVILAAVAVATSMITYVLFDQYLSVLLPRGRWTNW